MLSGPDHFDELCDILEASSLLSSIFLHLASGTALTQFDGLKLSFSHFLSHFDIYAAFIVGSLPLSIVWLINFGIPEI